jgi:hypothetical protein
MGTVHDSLGPTWTPNQRSKVQAVAVSARNAADQVIPLAKQTPNRVVRGIYEQLSSPRAAPTPTARQIYAPPTTDSHQPESAPAPGETYADGWLSHTAFQLADLIAGACAAVAELQCGDEIASGEAEVENERDHSRLLTSIETARR